MPQCCHLTYRRAPSLFYYIMVSTMGQDIIRETTISLAQSTRHGQVLKTETSWTYSMFTKQLPLQMTSHN